MDDFTPDTWALMESDPVIFTELMSGIGVEGVQVEEVYSVDPVTLSFLPPIYAFIFLFKWEREERPRVPTIEEQVLLEHIYFSKQMIRNACATQAILNIGINLAKEIPDDCRLSADLQSFVDFTNDFSPDMRGLALSNVDFIKACHHRYSGGLPTKEDDKIGSKEEESFHFVGILPIRDPINPSRTLLVEMDGLASAPHILASIDTSSSSSSSLSKEDPHGSGLPDWVMMLCPILMDRMNAFANHETRFNLMAVTQDKLVYLQKKLEAIAACDVKSIASIKQDMQDEVEARKRNVALLTPSHPPAASLPGNDNHLKSIIDSFCQKYQNLN